MRKAKPQNDHAKISEAALRLAAAKGWERVTPEAVIKESKISNAKIDKRLTSKQNIATIVVEETTREALALAPPTSGTPHDILFDLLMARFDVLQKSRKGVLAIAKAAKQDCGLSSTLARAVLHSMYEMVDAAKIDAFPRPVLAAGLGLVYGYAFMAWRRDKSGDMAKTMAALDRALRLSDSAVSIARHRS